jgi:nitronate monooxygenase
MWSKNKLTEILKIAYPIIQGPMSGASTPALVAAVSNAGGLGSLGAAQMSPDQIRNSIVEIRSLTKNPFAVNLFVPENNNKPSKEMINHANKILNSFRKKLDIELSPDLKPLPFTFNEQLNVILEEKVPIFSFTFGIMSAEIIKQVKDKKIIVIGTATTTREAKLLEQTGVDIIVAQGSEAGGHRGSAADTQIEGALIGGMALIPQIVDHVNIPVMASGGIMDGRGIAAALVLGASAVQMGTAFLTCRESGIHQQYREKLLASTDESTRLTRSFTGRYVRGINNQFIEEMKTHQESILPHPWQRFLTRDIVSAATQQKNTEFMPMWSGQAASLCREISASDLISKLIEEVNKVIKNF